MADEKITLNGETFTLEHWENVIKDFKEDYAKIHVYLHAIGIGGTQGGKPIVDILIGDSESLRQQLSDAQAALTAAQVQNAHLQSRLDEIRILARDEQWLNVTAQLNRVWRLAGGDKFMQPAPTPAPEAPATDSPKFSNGDDVMVASYGIDATFYHRAKVEDVIRVSEYGKKVYKYAVRYVDSGKLSIDVTEHQIKPYTEAPTLTSDEIDWLARHQITDEDGTIYYQQSTWHGFSPDSLDGELAHHDFTDPTPNCYIFHGKRDTETNRAAIAKRRKELGLEYRDE